MSVGLSENLHFNNPDNTIKPPQKVLPDAKMFISSQQSTDKDFVLSIISHQTKNAENQKNLIVKY